MFDTPPKNNNEQPEGEFNDAERLEAFLQMHPEDPPIPPESLRECGPEIAEFETMIKNFKETFSLEALHAITYLSREEVLNHPLRQPARLATAPIFDKLKEIKKETNISDEQYKELEAQREELQRAIGIHTSSGSIDHTR